MKRAKAPPAQVVSPPARPGQTLKVFAAAIFLALVLPLSLLAGLMSWHQYRILHTWPVADALVTKSEVTETGGGSAASAAKVYGVRFNFRYTAAGRVYDTRADLEYDSPSRSQAERWVEQMPVGSHQHIRYDPSHPATISLAAEHTPTSFSAPLVLTKWAGMAVAVCVLLLGLGWRKGRRPPSEG
ncbi:MAG TPA: DUF3592 domain-containing protein [Terriglobales bacterium]|nr:DUF3592 domain-containing protein [Terriglobales bacterium]